MGGEGWKCDDGREGWRLTRGGEHANEVVVAAACGDGADANGRVVEDRLMGGGRDKCVEAEGSPHCLPPPPPP